MKLTFLYSNGKKFTASNVIENSLTFRRNNAGNLRIDYQRTVDVDSDTLLAAVNAVLPKAGDETIVQRFSAHELLFGVIGEEMVTIKAPESGLKYVIVTESYSDDCSLIDSAVNSFSSDILPKGFLVIPVNGATITPKELADAIHLTL